MKDYFLQYIFIVVLSVALSLIFTAVFYLINPESTAEPGVIYILYNIMYLILGFSWLIIYKLGKLLDRD